MHFGRYLLTHMRPSWKSQYLDYKRLKKLIKEVVTAPAAAVYIPTKLSLSRAPNEAPAAPAPAAPPAAAGVSGGAGAGASAAASSSSSGGGGGAAAAAAAAVSAVQGTPRTRLPKHLANLPVTPQEHFFLDLEEEVRRIDAFVQLQAAKLRTQLSALEGDIDDADLEDRGLHAELTDRARALGDEFLHIEKFVNLNYAGLQKILKKHDKEVPNAPVFPFYMSHIGSQPWVTGAHQDCQVTLTRIFTQLHGAHGTVDTALEHHNLQEHTRQFWVRTEDVAQVKNMIVQHCPACELPTEGEDEDEDSDANIVNCLYLDNSSMELYHNLLYGRPYATVVELRWRGCHKPAIVQVRRKVHREGWRPELSVTDSFPLQESKIAGFLLGRWTFADAQPHLLRYDELVRQEAALRAQQQLLTLGKRTASSARAKAEALLSSLALDGQEGSGDSGDEAGPSDTHHPQRHHHARGASLGVGQRGGGPGASASFSQQPQQQQQQKQRPALASSASSGDIDAGNAERDKIAREFNLFKVYTEVQRLAESKSLQPVVVVTHRETVFAETAGGATSMRIEVQEHAEALLEYSYDGMDRLHNGGWLQEMPADRIVLPYALVRVSTPAWVGDASKQPPQPPQWLQALIDDRLLTEVHDFSKLLFGVCGLLPDMVRAVPVWIDDPRIQRALYLSVLGRGDGGAAAEGAGNGGAGEAGGSGRRGSVDYGASSSGPHGGGRGKAPRPEQAARQQQQQQQHPHQNHHQRPPSLGSGRDLDGSERNGSGRTSSGRPLAEHHETLLGHVHFGDQPGGSGAPSVTGSGIVQFAGECVRSGVAGWGAKLAERARSRAAVYMSHAGGSQKYVPEQDMANERMFLQNMTMGTRLGGIAVLMLGFASTAHRAAGEVPTIHISEVTALVLLTCAIYIVAQALWVFRWRSTRLYQANPQRYDDMIGPLVLNLMLAMAFFALFWLNVADLMEILKDDTL
ncbi:hypothetical protein FOA52_014455 [Chlamydomonas sp. UWO 241]|nr:hypothetical protein FOA52_014455 [Chlamydomonas sp. UWO 241]